MAIRTYTLANGQVADGGQVETELAEIYTNITNANIASNASIAYSKLNLALSIVNADISTSAAIAFSKLAALTSANILVGNGSNVATAVAMTGDIGITNAGVTSISSGVIVNADINASAAIEVSKTTLGTYTAPTAYSPTISADASMTISATSFVNSRYTQIGKMVIYNCSFTCTTGGTASARIRVPMPINPADTATNSFGGACRVTDASTNSPGMYRWSIGGYVEIFKQDGSNWSLSASTAVQAVIIYEVA